MLDSVANFISLTASQGYGSGDTTIVLSSGGSLLPSPEFNMVWYDSTAYPDPSKDPNVEIVRITAINGDTLTIERAQEGTEASAKDTDGHSYSLILGITAKMITDIGNNLQKPWRLVNLVGAIDGLNTTYTLSGGIAPFDSVSLDVKIARQPQEQGIDYTFSGTTVTYITPIPASLSGQPHTAKYQ